MSYKGVSVSRYRKTTITLAMIITMLVVFAFTMGAQTTRLHADDTVNNVKTWAELKKAINEAPASGTRTIKLTKDLVALDQVSITKNIKIVSDNDVTIYRHAGDANFTVFKVENGGELNLGSKVTMSGKVAKVKQDDPNFDDGSSSNTNAEWKVYWNVGYGTNEYYAVESTNSGLNRGAGLSCTLPDSQVPEGYYFVGWRVPNSFFTEGATGDTVLTNAQMAQRVKVPATGGGTLRVKAKWAKKTVYQGSKDLRTHPANGSEYGNDTYSLRKSPYGKYDLVTYDSNDVGLALANSTNSGFTAITSPASGVTAGQFYLQLNSTSGMNVYLDSNGTPHLRRFNIGQNANGSWQDYLWAPGSQWKYENGMIINVLAPNYCLIVNNGVLQLAEKNSVAGDSINYANKYWNDGNNADGWKGWEPSYTVTPAAPTVDGTEIDTTVNSDGFTNGVKATYYWKRASGSYNGSPREQFTDPASGEAYKGFFVQVESGGKAKLSGANFQDFNTVSAISNSPKKVTPIYVNNGNLEMTGGSIMNNSVGYCADETKSHNQTVQQIKSHLSAIEFTNTAGGIIFKGDNAKGTITGGEIKGNKADAGGLIVTDGANVTLGADSGTNNSAKINGNIGFHHAGAVLVENGATFNLRKTGQMADNVTWAKGGAVWATEWGTNGYVDADWSKWPSSFPTIKPESLAKRQPKGGGNFVMYGGNINDNTAFIRAGAIEVESNGVELYSGSIYNNNCRSLGGAIYVEGDAAEYSYTLYVNEGDVHNNVAVDRFNTTQMSVNKDADTKNTNQVLDRYLSNGVLTYDEHSDHLGSTYDRDFNGAMGRGGGIWLCPVGGTSVFAKGENKVIVDRNTATVTGTDFFLHKGNGAVMVQNLEGDWYEQQGLTKKGDKLNFDSEKGTVLNGPVAMINDANPSLSNSKGIQIYNNQSRDGGGIACNGTLMLGGPEDVFRYDARLKLKKTWNISTDTENIEFELYYKENGQKVGDPFRTIELDGNADIPNSNSGDYIFGDDIDGEWTATTENGKPVWSYGIMLPQYVEINGVRKSLYTFRFTDPDNSAITQTYDPLSDDTTVREKLFKAIQKAPDKKLTLQVEQNFEIVEKNNKFKVTYGAATAEATATSKEINLQNPAVGTNNATFHVTFTTATFGVEATNTDAPIEIPVTKEWKDYDGNIIMSQGVNYNANNIDNWFEDEDGNRVWVNWPQTWANNIKVKLTDTTGKINQEDLLQVAGGAAVTIKKVLAGQQNTGWDILGGKGRVDIRFDEREYYVVQEKATGNKVVLTMLKSEAEANKGSLSVSEYMLQAAAQKSGKKVSELEMADNGAARKVYFPKLVYKVPEKDDDGNIIKYLIKEISVQGETGEYVPTYTDANGNKLNMDATNVDGAEQYSELLQQGVTINNDRKVDVEVTKEWQNEAGTVVNTWPDAAGNEITFSLVKIGNTSDPNRSTVIKDENGNPIPYKNPDGSIMPNYYMQYHTIDGTTKTLTKEQFNSGTKKVTWTGLEKFTGSFFNNNTRTYENMIRNTYYVLEENVNGYKNFIPVEFTMDNSGYHGRAVLKYKAVNRKLTSVEATKQWKSGQGATLSWPQGLSVKFYVLREMKVDHFGNTIEAKVLDGNSTPYITVGGQNISVTSSGGKYVVNYNNKNYEVKASAFVEIDGTIYALKGGVKDSNVSKVLVNPVDKDGNEITTPKTVTASTANKTVTWDNMPYYDAFMPSNVSDEAAWKTNHKIHYWIQEEPVDGYRESVAKDNNVTDKQKFTVTNTRLDNKTNVTAKKVWNDGSGNTSVATRPKIKFELWRAMMRGYDKEFVHNSGYAGFYVKVGEDKYIEPGASGSALTVSWTDLPEETRISGIDYGYVYAPREMVRVGWADEQRTEEVYVYTDDMSYGIYGLPNNNNPKKARAEIVVTGNETSGYSIYTRLPHVDNTPTHASVPATSGSGVTKRVKVIDPAVLEYKDGAWQSLYKTRVEYQLISGSSSECGAASYKAVAYNTKPSIEKYVNKDVHQDLDTKNQVFTYDIMAYVPKWSTQLIIKDQLPSALEYVTTEEPVVAYRTDNNHTANGSVAQTTGYTNLTKTTHYSYTGFSNNNLVLTINNTGVNKILATDAENGKWVRVTVKAKIKDSVKLEGMTKEELAEIGFKEIKQNDPVTSTEYPSIPVTDTSNAYSHAGLANTATYNVTLDNNHSFENIPSNTVTVIPPASLEVEKKVKGTLGDLTKQFVFKIELTGLAKNGGNNSNKRDYYYGVNDSGKVYNNEALTSLTYSDGFNVNTDSNGNYCKTLWVKLKAGQKLEIKGLPVGAQYKITESASDHTPSYKITGTNKVLTANTVITADHVSSGAVVLKDGEYVDATTEMIGQTYPMVTNIKMKNSGSKATELATESNPIGATDKVTVTFTNHRDITTETGIIKDTWPWNIILLVLLILLAYDDQMRKIKNRLRVVRNSAV